MSGTATLNVDGGLSRLFDEIQSTVPGVQLPIIEMEVFNAIEAFCQQSTAWRETLEFTLPAGAREVDLNPVSAGALAVWVLKVDGLHSYSVRLPAIIEDSGDATQMRTGYARVVLKPSRLDAATIPAWLLTQYREGIKSGALVRLHGQLAKPYSSPQLAAFHGRMAQLAIRRARDIANRYNTDQTSGWRFPYFAAGRRRR
jgi:hypothetical protein